MVTWKELISDKLKDNKETWKDVIKCTLSKEELKVEFYAGYGSPNGKPFAVWTANNVYFPVTYDGAEWVSSVPRNPSDTPINHIGRW